jgi:dTDP-4-amino-4,6-dideoxygalactose transaminase
LKHLEEYNAARTAAADYYDQSFAGISAITTPFRAPYSTHAFHQYTLKLEGVSRDGLVQHLADHGIPSMIYYPVPGHRQKMFDSMGGSGYDLPITDWLTERVISLPMHSELDHAQQDLIVNTVKAFVS